MPNLKLLEAFYWVARLRGFHAAAGRLNLTQPTISYRIKELETQLGRSLLARTGRSFRLTAHGQALFIHAERITTAAQDLQNQFRTGRLLVGAFRIGVTDAFAAVCLPALLQRLAADQPELDVSVIVDNSHLLTRKLDDGELDVAIVSTPPILPGLRYEPLGHQYVGWIAGSGAPLSAVDPAWVAASRIFITPPPSNLDAITATWFQSVGLQLPRLSVCNSMTAIVGLIQSEAGIGILPLPLVEISLESGAMRRLDVGGTITPQAIFVAFDKGALDVIAPGILDAVRRVVVERAFCEPLTARG